MIKEYLKRKLKSIVCNASGFYCPKCILINEKEYPTALMHNIYDNKYHMFKSYIKCEQCNLTTPAYEKYSDVFDHWDDYFVKQEADLFENEPAYNLLIKMN